MTTTPVRRTTAIAVLPLLLVGVFGLAPVVGADGSATHQPHSVSRTHQAAEAPTPQATQAPGNTAWE